MRNYVLTQHEREMAREFLETGKKLNGFRVLILRMRENVEAVESDLDLIKKVIEAANEGVRE